MSRELAPGEVLLEDAWRSFPTRSDRVSSLKELVTSFGRHRHRHHHLELPPTRALAGVSVRIEPGETVGIVGRNGAGKTSTLRVLAGIIPLHRGFAGCGGRIATLIELGAGFGREFTGRENIRLNAALHGMQREAIDERMPEMIEFSELGHFIDAPIKTYSSGMLVRLGFSVAAHIDADVLLIDEVLAVGDESFQRKCLRRIAERIREGATVVLVSHAPATIEQACRRAVVLDGGEVVYDGETADAMDFYHRLLGLTGPEPGVPLEGFTGARLREAHLEAADGRTRQIFTPGEPLRVALTLEWLEDGAEAEIVLEVRQATGHGVFGTVHTFSEGPSHRELVFEVPRLTLLGGDYDMAVGLRGIGDTTPPGDRILSFSVAHVDGAHGVTDLRGTWSLAGTPVEVGP